MDSSSYVPESSIVSASQPKPISTMLYSTGQKRKAQAENADQLDTGFARKRIRTSERSGSVSEEESDDSGIDEYLPGTAGATKSVRSTSTQRGKKEHKPVHKSRSAKASKMSVDEQKASNSSNPVASLKGAHGRPLSREQIRKANHSLIERRRREKMNKAFADLRSMVPGLSGESEGIKGEFKLEVSLSAGVDSRGDPLTRSIRAGSREIGGTHEIPGSTSRRVGKEPVDISDVPKCAE